MTKFVEWVVSNSSGAGNAEPSGAPGFISGFMWGSCCSICYFLCSVLDIIGCPVGTFFFCPLYCLSLFDLRLMITPFYIDFKGLWLFSSPSIWFVSYWLVNLQRLISYAYSRWEYIHQDIKLYSIEIRERLTFDSI